MHPSPPYTQQRDALVDLGLLSRVVCHELNNLLAAQRGYARLLAHENTSTIDRQRWLDEIGHAADAQQQLLASLQQRAWSLETGYSARDTQRDPSQVAEHLEVTAMRRQLARTEASRRLRVHIPLVALTRMLEIIFTAAGYPEDDINWQAGQQILTHAEVAELGLAAPLAQGCLRVTLVDRSTGAVHRAWNTLADRILPGPDGSTLEWDLALVAGLFRQHGGILRFRYERYSTYKREFIELYLPRAEIY